jgi:hypothetical protein
MVGYRPPAPRLERREARPAPNEDDLAGQEQRRAAERQEREAERGVVAGMGDGQLVADGDRDQAEDEERQRPRAPPAHGAGVLGRVGQVDADAFGALEVAPPERDGPGEGDRQGEQPLERERLGDERGAGRQHGLTQCDDEEQAEALDEMPAGDLRVRDVDPLPAPREPVQGGGAAVAGHDRKPPEHESRVPVEDRSRHPERAGEHLPHEFVDEVLAERPAPQRDDEEHRARDLQDQVARDEQPRPPVERVADRDRHEQAGEHQPDEQQAHGPAVGVEPVRPPGRHAPRVEDRERQDRRLGAGPQVDVLEQVMRELPDPKT